MLRWQRLQKYAFVLFVLAIITALCLYLILKDQISLNEFRAGLSHYGVLAPTIFILFYTVATIFIPSTPFMALAGILFGFKYGLLYTTIGGFLSAILVFGISRKLGKDWVDQILRNKYLNLIQKYNKRLEKGGVADLILLRVAPIMPFNVLNILMGISRISLQNYILGTLLGLLPSNVLAVYFGALITKVF